MNFHELHTAALLVAIVAPLFVWLWVRQRMREETRRLEQSARDLEGFITEGEFSRARSCLDGVAGAFGRETQRFLLDLQRGASTSEADASRAAEAIVPSRRAFYNGLSLVGSGIAVFGIWCESNSGSRAVLGRWGGVIMIAGLYLSVAAGRMLVSARTHQKVLANGLWRVQRAMMRRLAAHPEERLQA